MLSWWFADLLWVCHWCLLLIQSQSPLVLRSLWQWTTNWTRELSSRNWDCPRSAILFNTFVSYSSGRWVGSAIVPSVFDDDDDDGGRRRKIGSFELLRARTWWGVYSLLCRRLILDPSECLGKTAKRAIANTLYFLYSVDPGGDIASTEWVNDVCTRRDVNGS